MSQHDLFLNLLRPAVLHILRATGFHYGKPSAVDTVVDLTARYLSLLAERTAYNAYSSHNDLTPDIADVRMAMQDCGLLVPTTTASEELWKEFLRTPLDDYNGESGARQMEEARRDAEDTADVREFIEWVKGEQNKEIRRIAGTYKPVATTPTEQLDQLEMDDYLSSASSLPPHSSLHLTDHHCSPYEEAQQDGRRVPLPGHRPRRRCRIQARQDRGRRPRLHRRVVPQDARARHQRVGEAGARSKRLARAGACITRTPTAGF
jgi:hypothetical protein